MCGSGRAPSCGRHGRACRRRAGHDSVGAGRPGAIMNQLDLNGRVAVVTGGARGIGRAIAERMIASGAAVALWDMDGAAAEATAAELGERASAQAVDQTDEAGVRAATEATLARQGRIDILVNNAGITGGNAPTWQLPAAEWRRV